MQSSSSNNDHEDEYDYDDDGDDDDDDDDEGDDYDVRLKASKYLNNTNYQILNRPTNQTRTRRDVDMLRHMIVLAFVCYFIMMSKMIMMMKMMIMGIRLGLCCLLLTT